MKPRSVLVLLGVVLVLGAFIYFFERDLPSTDERREQARKVLDLDLEDVIGLEIDRAGSRLHLERRELDLAPAASGPEDAEGDQADGEETEEPAQAEPETEHSWVLSEPVEAPADENAVEDLLVLLTGLSHERVLEDFDPAALGLAPPRATVTITHRSVTHRAAHAETESEVLELGAELPASDSMVVAVQGQDRAYVVSGELWRQLGRDSGDWRATELMPGSRYEIESIRLAAEGGELRFERRGLGEEYWLRQPVEDLAARGAVEDLLGALERLRVAAFLDDPARPQPPPPLADLGLEPPRTRVEVSLRRGRPPLQLELGAVVAAEEVAAEGDAAAGETAEPRRVYGRSGSLLFEVETALPALARLPAEAWRSRAWTSLEVYEIEALELPPTGGEAVQLERREGDWYRGEEVIDYDAVNDLLTTLAQMEAESLLPVGEKVGTGEPRFELTLRAAGDDEEVLRLHALGLATTSARPAVLRFSEEQVATLEGQIAAVREAPAEAAEAGPEEGAEPADAQ